MRKDASAADETSDSDEWGRIMDDACSIVSFSSSAFFNKDKSREEVDTVESSCCYFDKSVIDSLLTPEKVRMQQYSANVTSMRGRAEVKDESPDRSSDCRTNVTGVEEMFHAALRFHDDLQTSVLSSEGKDKSSSVSFAADTSFLSTIDGRSVPRKKKPEIEELNFLFGSPANKDDSFINSSFLGSPISVKRSPSLEISPCLSAANASEIQHSPSFSAEWNGSTSRILSTTPLRAGKHVTIEDQSSFASMLGLTPLQSELEPEVREPSPKKNLFSETTEPDTTMDELARVECSEESIELVRYTPTKPQYDHSITLPRPRVFGSNLQNRLNHRADNSIDSSIDSSDIGNFGTLRHQDYKNDENVRGVRLCRASKLKALGLRSVSLPSNGFIDQDDYLDRSDF